MFFIGQKTGVDAERLHASDKALQVRLVLEVRLRF
jgi:hypothetical protein